MTPHIVNRSVSHRVARMGVETAPNPHAGLGYVPVVSVVISTDDLGCVNYAIRLDYVMEGKMSKIGPELGKYDLNDHEVCFRDALAVAWGWKIGVRHADGSHGWKMVENSLKSEGEAESFVV